MSSKSSERKSGDVKSDGRTRYVVVKTNQKVSDKVMSNIRFFKRRLSIGKRSVGIVYFYVLYGILWAFIVFSIIYIFRFSLDVKKPNQCQVDGCFLD